jgi:hypothetical protein
MYKNFEGGMLGLEMVTLESSLESGITSMLGLL